MQWAREVLHPGSKASVPWSTEFAFCRSVMWLHDFMSGTIRSKVILTFTNLSAAVAKKQ